MSRRHLIDEAVFELAQRTHRAVLDDAAMQALVCDRLLPIVDALLTRYDEADCVIALEKLDIDLGEVEFAQIESELPRRLEAALATQLAQRIGAIGRDSAVSERAGMEVPESDRRIDRAALEIEQLEAFLYTGYLPRRAASTSPQDWLRRLSSQQAKALAAEISASPNRAIAFDRLALQFDTDSVLGFLRAIDPAHARTRSDNLDLLADDDRRRRLRAALEASMSANAAPDAAAQRLRAEFGDLDAALCGTDPAAVRALWGRWTTERRAPLRERLLAHHALRATQWIAHFNEALLRDMLAVIDGARVAFVVPLLDQPGLYLLGRPHAQESREAFGKRVLQAAFAQDIAVTFDDEQAALLLTRILSLGETQQAIERATGYVLTWRRALKHANHVSGSTALDRWLAAHARGANAMSGDNSSAAVPVVTAPKPMEQIPLARTVETPLPPDEPSQDAAYTEAERMLRAGIEAFAADPSRFEPAFRADFLRSVEQHAPPTALRVDYYRSVWTALEEMRPVDLEAIAAQAMRTPTVVEAAAVPVSTASSGNTALAAVQALHALAPRLHGMRDPDASDIECLTRCLDETCAEDGDAARRAWGEVLGNPLAAARVVQAVSAPRRSGLLALLRRADHRRIEAIAAAVQQAFVQAVAGNRSGMLLGRIEAWSWRFVFRYFHAGQSEADGAFIDGLALYLLQQSASAPTAAYRALIADIVKRVEAAPEEELKLVATASADTSTARAVAQIAAPAVGTKAGEEIHVWNAGLVLTAPYLPRLFGLLKLTEAGAFVDDAAGERAVHLLQFMVSGETHTPEHRLVLNKQLCGVRTGKPLIPGIDIKNEERELIEQMLAGMIAHWKVLGATTVAGLRQSFLQRLGTLRLKDEAWHLQVQPMAYDMLLDQLPWAYKLIKHSWMQRPIHVNWR